jgi:Dictyostelium (slime mold) repeat
MSLRGLVLLAVLAVPALAPALPICRPTDGCTGPADCDDGDVCNGREACVRCACESVGEPLDCDDGNDCTVDSCDPTRGCVHARVRNGVSCDDGDPCNGAETCQAGLCTAGSPPSCDDGNPCTNDLCALGLGCLHRTARDGASCSDGDVCNGDETCQGGTCTAGPAPDCDDHDRCTADGCDPASGCHHAALACDDGDACTTDACDATSGCVHTPVATCAPSVTTTTLPGAPAACDPAAPLACDDGDPCTDDACDAGAAACTHGAVTGFDAVTCVCRRGMGGACDGQAAPAAIDRRFTQGCGLIEQAKTAGTSRRTRALVRRAGRALTRGEKAVLKAARRGAIAAGCAIDLGGIFDDARGRARRWLTTP